MYVKQAGLVTTVQDNVQTRVWRLVRGCWVLVTAVNKDGTVMNVNYAVLQIVKKTPVIK